MTDQENKEEPQFEVGKYYYTQNGLFVRLEKILALQNNGTMFVVVEEHDDDGEGKVTEKPYVVTALYEDETITPTYLRKSALQEETNKLADTRNSLAEDIRKMETRKKDFLYDFEPKFKIGQKVWSIKYQTIEQATVQIIKLYITEKGHEVSYMSNSLDTIEAYATKEDAQFALDKILAERKISNEKYAKKRYEEAKALVEKYETQPPPPKTDN